MIGNSRKIKGRRKKRYQLEHEANVPPEHLQSSSKATSNVVASTPISVRNSIKEQSDSVFHRDRQGNNATRSASRYSEAGDWRYFEKSTEGQYGRAHRDKRFIKECPSESSND